MVTLRRLLELAGLKEDLPPVIDSLSINDAKRIFANEDQPIADVNDKSRLRSAWLVLQHKYHENGKTPNPRKLALINRAYQVLARATAKSVPDATQDTTSDADDEPSRNYAIWAWDGRFLTPGIGVDARPGDFDKVADAALKRMRRGFATPKAILLQTQKTYRCGMLVIYWDGKYLHPPKDYPCVGSPQNDQNLITWLKSLR